MRIVFAEDNYLVREGTGALLATVDDVELVASVEDAEQLMAAVEEQARQIRLCRQTKTSGSWPWAMRSRIGCN